MPHSFAFQPPEGRRKNSRGRALFASPRKDKKERGALEGRRKKDRRPSGALHLGSIRSELRFSNRLPDLSEKLCSIGRPGRTALPLPQLPDK